MTPLIFLKLSASVIIPSFVGYSFILYLLKGQYIPLSMKLACSYGLGVGIVAYWMFVLGILHIPYCIQTIGLPLFILGIFLFTISWKHKNIAGNQDFWPVKARPTKQLSWLHLALLIFIIINMCLVFLQSMSLPIIGYDALATIAYKAKVIFHIRRFPDLNLLPHSSYPLLIPLNQSWIAYCLNEWSDTYIKIIFPLTLTAFIFLQYNFIKIFTNKSWALISVALLLTSNLVLFHATISYRDLLLMYFNCSTILLIILWLQTRLNALLWISSFLAGFATFTKLEGSAYLILYLGIFLIFYLLNNKTTMRKKIINSLRFIVPSLFLCLSYHVYKACTLFATNPDSALEKMHYEFYWSKLILVPKILLGFFNNLFFTNNWSLIWLLLFVSAIYFPQKHHRQEMRILLGSLFFCFLFYLCYALFFADYQWIVGEKSSTTLSRLFLHFFPLAPILIALLNYDCLSQNNTY